jgi:uncharacterized protein (DUF3820 family)
MPHPTHNLHDASPMPYGAHKGKRMIDVPAPYLLALFDKQMFSAPGGEQVKAYIIDNMDVLKKEAANARR